MRAKNIKTVMFASMIAVTLAFGSVLSSADAVVTKDYQNHEIDNIMQQLAPYIINDVGVEKSLSANDIAEKQRLQDALERSQEEHKKKILNPELRNDLLKGHKLISDSDIPFLILATSPDEVIIQLSPEDNQYEDRIAKILEGIPYHLEYGEGPKRGACDATTDDCDPEIGGLHIQVNNPGVDQNCSLSMPMQKDNVDGFLTAGHCMEGNTAYVYQPSLTDPAGYIGYSLSSWQDFNHNDNCDCAWIKDTSTTAQQNGIFVYSGSYWVIGGTDIPAVGDQAMLRGYHNNNGIWYQSDTITLDNITLQQGGIDTLDAMGFPSPFQPGDSGGAVFYNGNYLGIAVAEANVNGIDYTFFIPWDNITANISGLGL